MTVGDIELTSAEPVPHGVIDRAQAVYDRVKLWPEHRMRPGAVTELGPGFNDLLLLRNLVPDLLSLARAGLEARKAEESMRERTAAVADDMRNKFGSPTGDAYSNGLWDQGVRIATAIRALPLTGDNNG